jgi:hypothetical protein
MNKAPAKPLADLEEHLARGVRVDISPGNPYVKRFLEEALLLLATAREHPHCASPQVSDEEEWPPQFNAKGGRTTFGLFVRSLEWAVGWIDKRSRFTGEKPGPTDPDWMEWASAHDLLKDVAALSTQQSVQQGEEGRLREGQVAVELSREEAEATRNALELVDNDAGTRERGKEGMDFLANPDQAMNKAWAKLRSALGRLTDQCDLCEGRRTIGAFPSTQSPCPNCSRDTGKS